MDMNNSNNTSLQTKTDLVEQLKNNSLVICFVKRDGTERIMHCTLQEGIVESYEKKTDRTREAKDNILPVWDLEANAWRSINIETIKTVEVR